MKLDFVSYVFGPGVGHNCPANTSIFLAEGAKVVIVDALCIPKQSCRAKHFLLLYSVASLDVPKALHDVLTAFKNFVAMLLF